MTTSWYDHPQYFEMVFRDETPEEVTFLHQAFQKYAIGDVRRVYEPGCGTGRLVVEMASADLTVVALDNSPAMIAYLKRRLKRRGLSAELVLGDMVTYACERPVDAAFCTFNTFRHLTDESSAVTHLRSVAASVRAGGIYILGFHCLPMDVDPESTERWTAHHAGTRVSVTFKVQDFYRRKRIEAIRVSIKATLPSGRVQRIRSEFDLRVYTPTQARSLLKSVGDVWDLVAVHDFHYEINETRRIDRDLIDAVFVLRKK